MRDSEVSAARWVRNQGAVGCSAWLAGTAYGTFSVCHLQVEEGKDLELKEKFDALRREHEEALQGEIPGQSNAPRSPSSSWGAVGRGDATAGVLVPVTLSSCSPHRAPKSA